jgi:hypothetical protein
MCERWPLHPAPWEFDLLARWVRKIALEYGVSYHVFCKRVLKLSKDDADQLNENPAEDTLKILSKGTGQPLERLRGMTWEGTIGRINEMLAEAQDDPVAFEAMMTRMRRHQ